MAIQNSTILTGATSSAAGGVSSTLSLTGNKVQNGIQVADMGVADYRIRPFINFKYRQPGFTAGVYGKAKNEAMIVIPKILTSGLTVFPLLRIGFEPHPEMTDAEMVKMLSWGAQLLYDADYVSFFKYGALA